MRCTIDKAGRFVIPKEIRELAGYKPGMELEVDYRDGNVVIEPVCKVKLFWKKGFLVSKVPGARKMTLAESNRWIRRSREGRL